MRKHIILCTCIALILFLAGGNLVAQPLVSPQSRTTPDAASAAQPPRQTTRPARPSTTQRPAQQQGSTQGTRPSGSGLLAMNLVALETFGDALGNIPSGTDVITSTYQFTFNSGMFVNSGLSGGQFTGWLTSLNSGPAISFSQPTGTLSPGVNTVALTNMPSGVASDVIAYLGRGGGGGFDVTLPPGLADYVLSHGIDPTRLSFDKEHSFVEINNPSGGGYDHATDFRNGQIAYDYVAEYLIPSVPGRIYGLGRQKITENMTPVPTDRFIFDYSYFHGVPLPYGKMPVNRFTPGLEKTFFNKQVSVEMRFPFAATIDNTLHTNNENRLNVARIGDATAILKFLVFKRERLAMTLGLGMSLPLAEDTRLFDSTTGREVIRSKNQSVHLMPYVGLLYAPNDRVFIQSYFQVDADANGSSIYVADLAGEGTLFAGRAKERTFAYTSLSMGYWMFRNYCQHGTLKNGMNLMGELHWTQSIDRSAGVRHQQGNYLFDIGREQRNYTVVNMTLGSRFLINEKTNIGIGYSVPLRNKTRQFDGELRVAVNRYF